MKIIATVSPALRTPTGFSADKTHRPDPVPAFSHTNARVLLFYLCPTWDMSFLVCGLVIVSYHKDLFLGHPSLQHWPGIVDFPLDTHT